MRSEIGIIIPALEPEYRLLDFVIDLQAEQFSRIVIVDDGSGIQYQNIFEQAEVLGCKVVHHPKNLGKGAALRTGIRTVEAEFGIGTGIITADADGQHSPEDIARMAIEMEHHPDALILGSRNFDGEDVPARSKIGNKITSKFFGLITGKPCTDTQTGLRGIPANLVDLALSEDGDRYEYEMNFLMDAADRVELVELPIRTIYEDGNAVSHFRPVRDSVRIYARVLRFLASSLAGFAVDYSLFALLLVVLPWLGMQLGLGQAAAGIVAGLELKILLATAIARTVSGIVNFTLNKKFAFKSKGDTAKEFFRYGILFVFQMAASACFTSVIAMVLPAMMAKILVDLALFFANFVVQRRWVFAPGAAAETKDAGYMQGVAGKGSSSYTPGMSLSQDTALYNQIVDRGRRG